MAGDKTMKDRRSIEIAMDERGYYTFYPEPTFPVDVENKTGHQIDVEIHTFQQGRIAIILRPPKSPKFVTQ
jgi:hypothetical protein